MYIQSSEATQTRTFSACTVTERARCNTQGYVAEVYERLRPGRIVDDWWTSCGDKSNRIAYTEASGYELVLTALYCRTRPACTRRPHARAEIAKGQLV